MTQPGQVQGMKVFRYKLDFYYQQALLYLLTILLYGGVRGTIVFEKMPSLSSDPILYIIGLFVMISFVVLMLNKMRDRKLMIGTEEIVFHNKFHERRVQISEIEWLYIGRERSVRTAGRSQVIIFKVIERRRWFRIRVGRYEHEMELIQEIERIGDRVPKAKRPMFGVRGSKF